MDLSLQKLGDGLGISKQAAGKLAKRGMPKNSVAAARLWRAENLNPAQRKPPPGAVDAPKRVASDENFDQARTREKIAEADKAEMEAAKMNGELIERAVVRAEFAKQAGAVRDGLLNVPARLAPVLFACKSMVELQQMLDTELRAVLAQFVGEA